MTYEPKLFSLAGASPTGARYKCDGRPRVETGTVDGGLRPREKARELTVATSAMRGARGGCGRALDNAAGHDVSPVLESGTVRSRHEAGNLCRNLAEPRESN